MSPPSRRYIWQLPDWPQWRYDLGVLAEPLTLVSRRLGVLAGRMADVGVPIRDVAALSTLGDDVVHSSAIEGEVFNADSVRSSLARRLGVDIGALAPVDRFVDGVVDMMVDATINANDSITEQRLCAWHAALFPSGYSGMTKVRVGQWRDDATGAMQVVSGPLGRERVHYEAPPAARLAEEMHVFLAWANGDTGEPAFIKAGLAHLWLVTLHPFDDGNGRIARAVGDLFLTRADGFDQRFYSLSAQIQRDRKAYYAVLEQTQRGDMDVTAWLVWFIHTLDAAIGVALAQVDATLAKGRFWQRVGGLALNSRQVEVLNRLLDGFEGNLTTRKWAVMTKCSQDTALRDISALVELGILAKGGGRGRSTSYTLSDGQRHWR